MLVPILAILVVIIILMITWPSLFQVDDGPRTQAGLVNNLRVLPTEQELTSRAFGGHEK